MARKTLLTEWGEIRKQGPLLFILKYGSLGWGLGFGGLFWILVRFAEPKIISTKFIIALYSISIMGGTIFGTYLWYRLEHHHKKLSEHSPIVTKTE